MPPPLVDSIISAFKNLKNLKVSVLSGNRVQITNNSITNHYNFNDPEVAAAFAKEMFKAKDQGVDILAIEFDRETGKLESAIGNKPQDSILGLFKDILPPTDYDCLRVAVYIREYYKSGDHKKVQELKGKLISQYGIRAGNICNLCSAGYFESLIRPLYEEMAKEIKGYQLQSRFIYAFDNIVDDEPFALFVNGDMTSDLIAKRIKEKLEQFTHYGVDILNIHGIGIDNVTAIKEALVVLTGKHILDDFEQSIEISSYSIVAKLRKKGKLP